jgi:hypothetical protein
MAGDSGINALLAMGLERTEGADLINAHESAVTRNVASHDSSQPALYLYRCHGLPPDIVPTRMDEFTIENIRQKFHVANV